MRAPVAPDANFELGARCKRVEGDNRALLYANRAPIVLCLGERLVCGCSPLDVVGRPIRISAPEQRRVRADRRTLGASARIDCGRCCGCVRGGQTRRRPRRLARLGAHLHRRQPEWLAAQLVLARESRPPFWAPEIRESTGQFRVESSLQVNKVN